MPRTRNERLDALLREAGWSRAQTAAAFNRIAAQNRNAAGIGRSHVSMWVGGTRPASDTAVVLCAALTRRLKRIVTPDELGFAGPGGTALDTPQWDTDPLTTLADLGRADLDAERRSILTGSLYSALSMALPGQTWWQMMAATPSSSLRRQRTGRGDVDTVRELTAAFSRVDQRRGGGHGRRALVQYLHSDVAGLLHGTFAGDDVRRDMFSAASELSYLSGWTAFDNSEHATAQRYFVLAVKLAARADDYPLSGHILRAMAHQAIDLGEFKYGLDLAAASIEGRRYASATPRERALLSVVHARALAANGLKAEAARTLVKAEDDLTAAEDGIQEPDRTFFFGKPPSRTKPRARYGISATAREQ